MNKKLSNLEQDVEWHLKQREKQIKEKENLKNIYAIIGYLDIIKKSQETILDAEKKIEEIKDGANPTKKAN